MSSHVFTGMNEQKWVGVCVLKSSLISAEQNVCKRNCGIDSGVEKAESATKLRIAQL